MTNATTNGQSVIYANGKIDAKATNGVGYPPPPIISPVTSFADYQECLALTHQLYRAWDEGNFSLIEPYLAPTLDINFTAIGHIYNPNMPRQEFIAQQSAVALFTDDHLRAQHIAANPILSQEGPDRIVNCFSLLARHARTTVESGRLAMTTSHRCGTAWHYYERLDGQWYFKGLKYQAGWSEGNRSSVFGFRTESSPQNKH